MTQPVNRARQLRRFQTDAEKHLWRSLRNRGVAGCKFRRQHPVGPYVCDFVCLDPRLVIEVDGGHHAQQAASDRERSEFLAADGFRELRFWNHEVLADTEAVLQRIYEAVVDDRLPCQSEEEEKRSRSVDGVSGGKR